jgi:hypothetical protein
VTLHDTAQAFARSVHYRFAISASESQDVFRLLWREMTVGIHAPVLQHAIDVVAEAFEIEGSARPGEAAGRSAHGDGQA